MTPDKTPVLTAMPLPTCKERGGGRFLYVWLYFYMFVNMYIYNIYIGLFTQTYMYI